MNPKSSCTLEDVAREAGVSIMAASVVLNGARSSARVSEATRERIKKAAEKLSYRSPGVRRERRRQKVQTIGVVARKLGEEINLYVLEMLDSVLEATSEHRKNAQVFHVSEWQHDRKDLVQFAASDVDALVFVGPYFDDAFLRDLPADVRVAAIHPNSRLKRAVNLDIDNEAGGFLATRHLIELGHRRIMHLPGPLHLAGSAARYEGYKRAIAESGLQLDLDLVLPGGYGSAFAKQTMLHYLEEEAGTELPTAAFCCNDSVAVGCMEALAEYGFEVPRHVSIVGFDDSLAARMTLPPLTTVRQPLREMGRKAVELLIASKFPEDGLSESGLHRFPIELVRRASVYAPPKVPLTIPSR